MPRADATEYEVIIGVSLPPDDLHYEPGTIIASTLVPKADRKWMEEEGIIKRCDAAAASTEA